MKRKSKVKVKEEEELRLMTPETEEEQESFDMLQDKLNQLKDDTVGHKWLMSVEDSAVLRFLRGNDGDVDAALERLLQAAKWRFEARVEQVLYEWPQDNSHQAMAVKEHWPMGIVGTDKRGRPVQFNRIGLVDFTRLYKRVGERLMMRNNVYYLEKNLEMNPHITSILLIDMGHNKGEKSPMRSRFDVTWVSRALQFLRAISHVFDYYPEMLYKILVVRPPSVFWFGWTYYAQYLLNEKTRQKIVFIPRSGMKEALLEYMDEDAIPEVLGGKSPVQIPTGGVLPKEKKVD